MRSLGVLFLVFGLMATAFLLLRLPFQLVFLLWIDNWGPNIGWAIRIGLIVVGLALIMLGKPRSPRPPD